MFLSTLIFLLSYVLEEGTLDIFGMIFTGKVQKFYLIKQVLICLVGSYIAGHVFAYVSELFPSTVRGFVMGLVFISGNLSASLIPYIGLLTDFLGAHFLSGFVPFSLGTLVFSFYLPDMINETLEN